uniref:Uncharacterized protein n=1 Tax=Meloidogyne incognita TaxID=6306 RepID=A0A914LWY2_MELIC
MLSFLDYFFNSNVIFINKQSAAVKTNTTKNLKEFFQLQMSKMSWAFVVTSCTCNTNSPLFNNALSRIIKPFKFWFSIFLNFWKFYLAHRHTLLKTYLESESISKSRLTISSGLRIPNCTLFTSRSGALKSIPTKDIYFLKIKDTYIYLLI